METTSALAEREAAVEELQLQLIDAARQTAAKEASVAAVEQDLAAAMEEMDKLQDENAQLSDALAGHENQREALLRYV